MKAYFIVALAVVLVTACGDRSEAPAEKQGDTSQEQTGIVRSVDDVTAARAAAAAPADPELSSAVLVEAAMQESAELRDKALALEERNMAARRAQASARERTRARQQSMERAEVRAAARSTSAASVSVEESVGQPADQAGN